MGKKCEYINCEKYASYNFQNEKPKFCSEHKTNEMVNVKHKKCLKCDKLPYYNLPNEKIGLYCDEHKLDGMVNIKSKICQEKGCTSQASYNIIGEKTPKYCSKHKLPNMVHVNHCCKYDNCKLMSLYNFPDKKTGLYCFEHKLDGMIDITHKKCVDCDKIALYNLPNEKPLYCSSHKKENMVDVVTKKCLKCNKIPNYNLPNLKTGLYCNEHKLEGMVDVKSNNCIIDGCFRRALYGDIGEKQKYCSTHKKDDMKDTINKRCKSEFCETFIRSEKYDNYCLFCYIHLFPDSELTTNYKTKEKSVVDYIKNKYNQYDWIYDKKIYDGCSKRRPDLLLDLGYHILIIEIDENQHCKYDSICENKRIMEISKDLNHRNIIFIRFNPDKYYNEENKLVDSCWKVNKKGLLQIKDTAKWNERLTELSNKIDYWINNHNDKMINVENLFFDKNI